MPDLQDLVKHRRDLLLAEVAAWLHDARKAGIQEGWVPNDFKQWLETRDVAGIHIYEDRLEKWILAQSHGIAHFDKQDPDPGSPESEYLSSPFGFEKKKSLKHSSRPLWLDNKNNLFKREYARTALQNTYADGRIPINEVHLWSWAETTASLNKTAWIMSLEKGLDLKGIFLDKRQLQQDLDLKLQALMQRNDGAIAPLLNELQKNTPSTSYPQGPFSNLKTQISDLGKWVDYADSWLQRARSVSSSNQLTQRQWEDFIRQVEALQSKLKQVISLFAWRLLSIRTNGLDYLLSAPSIPDLLARKDLLTDAWNRVRKVLEEEYPLGLEVYRDENGPVFVVPDLDNLLGLSNSADNRKTLREYILEAFRRGTVKDDACLAIGGEVVPQFELSRAWSGQKDPGTGQLDLPPIGEMVAEDKTPPLQSDPESVAQSWCHLSKPQEVCTVCGLRPQGPGKKAKDRKMCDICEERRADRARAWAEGAALSSEDRFKQGKPDTIWLDEVADKNGRIALIVGTFDLRHWLDGTLVRSLAVRTPNNQNGHTEDKVAKNPSFARLRRVWETTRRFWQDVAPTDAPPEELEDLCKNNGLKLEDLWEGPLSLEKSLAGQAIGEKRSRLFLKGALVKGDLGPFHAYEMMVQGRKVAVLWVPPEGEKVKDIPDEYRGGLWVIENLEYLASQNVFGCPMGEIFQQNGIYEIYEPSEYGRPGGPTAQFKLEERKDGPEYVPLIPILAEPRTFMALVPAEKAVEVVRAIKAKYEREMGKVRNRLPLHLGIVFADAHQPLRTILDAGRRMMKQRANIVGWKVNNVRKQPDDGGTLPERFKDDAGGQFAKWYEIDAEQNGCKITWYIPAVMGDGQTKDNWYPYVFLTQDGKPTNRNLYYQAPNPFNPDPNGNPRPGWLVHAGELQPGDVIYFTPATLDFIFLDHGGRRFEIAYDKQGRRLGTLRHPYLLDELDDLATCWEMLSQRLHTRQIHQVRDLIETKRREWFPDEPEASVKDPTFQTHCQAVLHNAEWKQGQKPQGDDMKRLTRWAVTGLLADAVELFYHIMKQRPEEEV